MSTTTERVDLPPAGKFRAVISEIGLFQS